MTPEGRVKKAIKKALDKYKDLYSFMPVPSGFGKSSLDYILCYRGRFVAIEAKAPGKKPTPRQKAMIGAIERAGGRVLVIDGDDGVRALICLLEAIDADHWDMEF